jgi:hypothetical protein
MTGRAERVSVVVGERTEMKVHAAELLRELERLRNGGRAENEMETCS